MSIDQHNTKMMMIPSRVLSLLFFWAAIPTVIHGNKFDEDLGNFCKEKAESHYCLKDPQAYFECPNTCARHLRPAQFTFGAFESADGPFFKFQLEELGSEKKLNFDDFDGEITVVSLIPLHPGMAQFHYNLLDHLLDIYKFVLNIVVIPMPGTDGVSILPREGSKVHILEGGPDNPLVKYLKEKMTWQDPKKYNQEHLNSFIISSNGGHISMHVYPDMQEYRKFIDDQLKELDKDL